MLDCSSERAQRDPLAVAREALFPPIESVALGDAAEAIERNLLEAAEALISGHLRRNPDDPDALNLLGDIARRHGHLEKAERLLARCGRESCYRFNHSILLLQLGRYEQALELVVGLLSDDPDNPLYRHQKAKVLRGMNRFPEALACRRSLVEDFPDCAEFWLGYGDALRAVGQTVEAVSAYRKALELAPLFTTAYSRLCDLKTYRFSDAEIASMEAQLKGSGVTAEDRANLHFVLGKAYGDLSRYAESYASYAKANALRRLAVDADPDRLTAHRRNCEALFTPAFFAERQGWGSPDRAPIFIVGMPRSGSTLVEQVFSSHSAVEGLGELPDMEKVLDRLLRSAHGAEGSVPSGNGGLLRSSPGQIEAYPRALSALAAEDAYGLGRDYLAFTRIRRAAERPLFTDKTLSNFSHVGLIHLILPKAKIVDVRRHPLDCGWSCFINHFPAPIPFSYRLGDIARHYADYMGLMKHFDSVLPGRIHRVIYEQLLADPEGEIRRLLDYLELPFEDACLRFHENRRAVTTLSSEQVRNPLYQTGGGQWRPYEKWLGPLKSALTTVLNTYPDAP